MYRNRLGLVAIAIFVACSAGAQSRNYQPSAFYHDGEVTGVSGESWLEHLNRAYGDTSMGITGRLGPGPQEEVALHPPPQASIVPSTNVDVLRGADLYRLNCRGCHGESGAGAPPEINSLINPVRATSVPVVLDRMKKMGTDMSYSEAAKLAQESQSALMDRLHKGGESMPPFSQLNEAETH